MRSDTVSGATAIAEAVDEFREGRSNSLRVLVDTARGAAGRPTTEGECGISGFDRNDSGGECRNGGNYMGCSNEGTSGGVAPKSTATAHHSTH